MYSSNKTFGLFFVLLAICFFGLQAQAEYGGGSETMAPAETSTYVFLSAQSAVVKIGGFVGLYETYSIEGQFQLTLDFDAGTASFDKVNANLTDESGSLYAQSLGVIFNMTALTGNAVDDTTIEFVGKTTDGTESDIRLTLTFRNDSIHLTGRTVPPPDSADLFFYELEAIAWKKYGGGSGTANDPYLIYTAEQMNEIGDDSRDWDKHFKLMADVDLSSYMGTDFNIIGTDRDNPFTGVFDGNDHTISNFSYTSTDTHYIGLFGFVRDPNAQIKDLGLLDPNVDAGTGECVGSLVGYIGEGTITNCYVEGGSVSGDNEVGGLVGGNGSTISSCYATCNVSCSGSNWYGGVGGLVGFNSCIITNCYATGSVMGNYTVGGLLGMNSGRITNCYSTGSVLGIEGFGGLVGRRWGGTIMHSFWDIETSGQPSSDDGTGKTTAEMQTAITFLFCRWDFVGESENGTEDIWSICEGTNYPRLTWQIPAGDFVCPDGITGDDFSFFLEHWGDNNCDLSNDYCQGTDLDQSGTVDAKDLEIFLENWLAIN